MAGGGRELGALAYSVCLHIEWERIRTEGGGRGNTMLSVLVFSAWEGGRDPGGGLSCLHRDSGVSHQSE